MEQFEIVDHAQALVRYKYGIQKIVDLYTRKRRLFIKHGKGFVAICAFADGHYMTVLPNVKIIEIECDNLSKDNFDRPVLISGVK